MIYMQYSTIINDILYEIIIFYIWTIFYLYTNKNYILLFVVCFVGHRVSNSIPSFYNIILT
jgi:hypothetical protein